jgi:membrane protein DedA with SNARE-associated domain
MPDLGPLLQTYGYWVLAAGCLLEGETVLVLAGYAAQLGHLDLWRVICIAAVAGFVGDQCFFWLGRRHGAAVLARVPAVARQAARVHRLIARYHGWVIVGVRFAYGLRIAGPILIGTAPVAPLRFALFNAFGAALWAVLVASLGWSFGQAAEALLGDVRRYELALVGVIVAVALLIWWFNR